MPESISSFGVAIAPAQTTISRRVRISAVEPSLRRTTQPTARPSSISKRCAVIPVTTRRFGRLRAGRR